MSGRIRSIKPEWLEDEELLRSGSEARVLSVSLMLLADDYGNGRCIPEVMAAQIFPFDGSPQLLRDSLARLSSMGFVRLYRLRGQTYFHIQNWKKHQKVDKPGKPRVPGPESNNVEWLDVFAGDSRNSRESLGPDHDHDLDPDQDQDREGRRACARAALPPPPASFADSVGAPEPEPPEWVQVASVWQSKGWQGDTELHKQAFVRIALHAREHHGSQWLNETRARFQRWIDARPKRIHGDPKWFLQDWQKLGPEDDPKTSTAQTDPEIPPSELPHPDVDLAELYDEAVKAEANGKHELAAELRKKREDVGAARRAFRAARKRNGAAHA